MIPFRVTGYLVLKALDGVLALGIKLDEWASRRRRKKGLSFKDVAHIKAQIDSASRPSTAKTVIIPKRP